MITMRELMTGPTTSPDGRHWEPALPLPDDTLKSRLRDAWAVLTGRAHAIIPTPILLDTPPSRLRWADDVRALPVKPPKETP